MCLPISKIIPLKFGEKSSEPLDEFFSGMLAAKINRAVLLAFGRMMSTFPKDHRETRSLKVCDVDRLFALFQVRSQNSNTAS
jgi:hypothetical protein